MMRAKSSWCRRLAATVLPILMLALATPAVSVEIESVSWGFDGKVVQNQFNVLTVIVSNPGDQPFNDGITLRADSGLGRGGLNLAARCPLGPGGRRVLQFYPYVDEINRHSDWALRPRGDRAHEVRSPPAGTRAAIQLVSSTSVGNDRCPFLSAFQSERFPPVPSAAIGTLATVIINEPLSWDAPRAEAFVDWIRAGGVVHLYHNAEGRHPVFSGALDVLNSPQDSFKLSAGEIHRHAERVTAITRQQAERWHGPNRDESEDLGRSSPWLAALNRLTTPDIKWGLIIFLALVYLILLGPTHYLFSRKRPKVVASFALFFAGIAGFCLLFGFIGQRGFGESSKLYTVSIARPLESGRYEVTQWLHYFTKAAGEKRLQHANTLNLYHFPNQFDPAGALMENGRDGYAQFAMPVFSSRAAQWRGITSGPSIDIEVTAARRAVYKSILNLSIDGIDDMRAQVYVRIEESLYRMRPEGSGKWHTDWQTEKRLPDLQEDSYDLSYASSDPLQRNEQMVFVEFPPRLVLWLTRFDFRSNRFRDFVEVYIYQEAPESMQPSQPVRNRERHYVLYALEISDAVKDFISASQDSTEP